MRDREFVESELSRCNRCGYCMQSCPVYRTLRFEAQTARARNETVRRILRGESGITKGMIGPFFDCLLCGACTNDCFGRVQTKELMVRAREAYRAEYGEPMVQRYIFRKLLTDPRRLSMIVRAASVGKNSGLSGIARRLGLLRWLSPSLEAADRLVSAIPRVFLRDNLRHLGFHEVEESGVRLMRLEPDKRTRLDVVYFVGCATNFELPHIGEATIRLLSSAGCRITIAPNYCCGLPPYSYGDIESSQILIRMNAELLGALDCDVVATECGSCSGFLKEYGRLMPDSSEACTLSAKTKDVTQLLADLSLPKPVATGGTVTYHDPCHLGRHQGITEAPRRLLVDSAGMKLMEMAESNWCCGGAGSYNLSHPELSEEILARKIARISETGAETVCTACPACIIQISSGIGRPVRHVVEVLADRQGLTQTKTA